MTDEMAVQGNRPLPYVIGGAAVGGTAGYLAANKLPFKKPMYSSYEDILKEVQDTTDFEALKKDKAEDVVKALDAAKIENEKLSNLGKLSFEEITSADLSKFDIENKARVEYEAAVKALKETTPDDKLIEKVAKEIYGADGVTYDDAATKELQHIEQMGFGNFPVCIAKTQYSLSDNPKLLGRPENFTINVREAYVDAGAGFVVILTGKILTMPGLPTHPAAENINYDEESGKITGLF